MWDCCFTCKHPFYTITLLYHGHPVADRQQFLSFHSCMQLLITPCPLFLQLILLKRKLFPRRRVNSDSNPERVWETKSSLSSPTSTPPLLLSVEDRKGSRPGGPGGIWRSSVRVLHQHRWRMETRVRWWWNIFQKMMDWAGRWRE